NHLSDERDQPARLEAALQVLALLGQARGAELVIEQPLVVGVARRGRAPAEGEARQPVEERHGFSVPQRLARTRVCGSEPLELPILCSTLGAWRSWLARFLDMEEVRGSSPFAPTRF